MRRVQVCLSSKCGQWSSRPTAILCAVDIIVVGTYPSRTFTQLSCRSLQRCSLRASIFFSHPVACGACQRLAKHVRCFPLTKGIAERGV